jgi:hypothetical protein
MQMHKSKVIIYSFSFVFQCCSVGLWNQKKIYIPIRTLMSALLFFIVLCINETDHSLVRLNKNLLSFSRCCVLFGTGEISIHLPKPLMSSLHMYKIKKLFRNFIYVCLSHFHRQQPSTLIGVCFIFAIYM